MPLPRNIRLSAALLIASCCLSGGQTPTTAASGIEGVIMVSPIHGGPVQDGTPSAAPLAKVAFVVKNGADVVASFITDEQGRFRISVAPGHYSVSRQQTEKRIGRYGPFEVEVVAGQVARVEWICDTGMR